MIERHREYEEREETETDDNDDIFLTSRILKDNSSLSSRPDKLLEL